MPGCGPTCVGKINILPDKNGGLAFKEMTEWYSWSVAALNQVSDGVTWCSGECTSKGQHKLWVVYYIVLDLL